MRRPVIAASVFVLALLSPRVGGAQMYYSPAPLPQVTAAAADWQRTGQPLFLAGTYYDPAGPTVYFDGEAMRPTGIFRGVLLYEDPTAEPGSMVYVPVGQKLMRPYRRRRDESLAATDWWMPSLPMERRLELYDRARGFFNEPFYPGHESRFDAAYDRVAAADLGPTGVESVPAPRSSDGVWIVFEGDRWYSDGKAQRFSADRFTPAGNYRGFPVYRDQTAAGDRIFVTVVADGPVAPYARR
jgi:hypothetical protein